MKRGDIYRADLDPVVGSEQGGTRPVVIIQNDIGNLHSPTVIVAAITTRHKKPHLPVHVPITAQESGLARDSVVLTEQVRTLEKSRLTRYLGALSEAAMRRIDRALAMSLGTGGRYIGGNTSEPDAEAAKGSQT
ncbi:MAG: type II toxin-antitoxin system PemK/MazF family toxin [Clostridia bacterium]|nr:type II toxin-antitoxin system PemK/MazF family toxin [Clostridia bacterium]